MARTALTAGALKHLLIDGVDIGRTMSEFMVERNTSGYLRVTTQQTRGTIDIEENAGTTFTCGTTLAESVLENFAHALGVDPGALVDGQKINLAESGALRQVQIEGVGPGTYDRDRYFKFPRAASISTGALVTWAQDTQSGIPIQFEALQDPFLGSWGEIHDFIPYFKDQPAKGNPSVALFRKEFSLKKGDDWKGIGGSTDGGALPLADVTMDRDGNNVALTYSIDVVDNYGVRGLDQVGRDKSDGSDTGGITFTAGTRVLAGTPTNALKAGDTFNVTYKVAAKNGTFSTRLFKIKITE